MKISLTVARYLLGFIFVVSGLNGFLHFLPVAPPPGIAGDYFRILFISHYMVPVFVCQLIGGAFLLANRYVPFALALLAPVIVNILLFHILIAGSGLSLPLLVTTLWGVLFFATRAHFSGLFAKRV